MTVKDTVLTFEERRVGWLMLAGYSIRAIACEMHVSEITVMFHRFHLCQKLDVLTREDLEERRYLLSE